MTTVLVAVDGSDPAEEALSFALERHREADLTALAVLDPSTVARRSPELALTDADTWAAEAEAEMRAVLADAARQAEAVGVDLATDLVYGSPARAIVDYADTNDVDQVVVGSRGRSGVSRVLLGSVAETVVRRSAVPVTVVP